MFRDYSTTHKIYSDGGHYITTNYVYDSARIEIINKYYDKGLEDNKSGDELIQYIFKKYISIFGKDDYHDCQLSDVVRRKLARKKKREYCIFDAVFENYFLQACKQRVSKNKRLTFIKEALIEEFGNDIIFDEYIEKSIKRQLNNIHSRLRRFKQKVFLNDWNYFITITYDSNKMTEDEFREHLRRTLTNFYTRRQWKYMGIFEYGKRDNRLHFHALAFIPNGQLPGLTKPTKRYSSEKGRITEVNENSFFLKTFGYNDFSTIESDDIDYKNISTNLTVNYILKYMFKDQEKLVYSRGTPSFVLQDILVDDVCCGITRPNSDFVSQYVLYGDVLESPGLDTASNCDTEFEY